MNAESSHILAFAGNELLCRGDSAKVAVAMKRALDSGDSRPLLAFDERTSRAVDFDLGGTEEAVRGRLLPAAGVERARGRPKLGVTSREITLLPRHWDWLAAQPGGASAVIRKLIESARRTDSTAGNVRTGKESLYRFITAMAGNEPGYEEAVRALFAEDRPRFLEQIAAWPKDIREHSVALAGAAFATESGPI